MTTGGYLIMLALYSGVIAAIASMALDFNGWVRRTWKWRRQRRAMRKRYAAEQARRGY